MSLNENQRLLTASKRRTLTGAFSANARDLEKQQPDRCPVDRHASCAPIALSPQTIGLAWLRAALRRGEMFSSSSAFLLSFSICFVGLGYGAYSYATWLIGA